MEQSMIADEIRHKARELAEDFGAEFVVELVGDYLGEADQRMARLRQALSDGDATILTYEAHTLKSSSANIGAQSFSDLAKRFEEAGRGGALSSLETEIESFQRHYAVVKLCLEELRQAPERFLNQER